MNIRLTYLRVQIRKERVIKLWPAASCLILHFPCLCAQQVLNYLCLSCGLLPCLQQQSHVERGFVDVEAVSHQENSWHLILATKTYAKYKVFAQMSNAAEQTERHKQQLEWQVACKWQQVE